LQYRFIKLIFFVTLIVCVTVGVFSGEETYREQAKPIDFNVARELKFTADRPADPAALRFANWNIDHGSRLDTLASELIEDAPDLCLLQEVDWNATRSGDIDVGAELARRLHLNMSYGVEFEELSQEHGHAAYIGQATLTRLPIRRSRVLRFTRQSSFWKPHAWIPSKMPLMQRRLGSRIALVTDLDWRDKLLVVYNAHLESRSMGQIQVAQLDEMLADLKTYPAGTDAIIGGDLNSKYFPSIFLRKLKNQGFSSALGDRIERTHAIAMALDWIFVRGPFEWSGGSVRRDLKGSDHYPIYATLTSK
jgi:endonuclease/exonuclease/phosphatase family metal-dependent hydrolase